MSKGNQDHVAAAAAINDRLESLLEGKCNVIGTPLAAAVATALHVDRRRAPANDRNSIGYSNEQLLRLAIDVSATLDAPRAMTTLPFGTVLETKGLGEILLDGELWTLDAGRPGLHPVFTTRKDAHGPNLELLHHHISRLTQKHPCRRLGLPQPCAIYGNDERHLLHFAPCAEAGGVVLQRMTQGINATRFCGAFPQQIEEFAEEIVEGMRSFWKRRNDIAKQAAEVRAIAEASIAAREAAIDAIIIEMRLLLGYEDLDFYVHYRGIDEALRPGLVLDYIPSSLRHAIRSGCEFEPVRGVSERYQELEEFRRVGADGKITELAAAVLASGRVDSEFIRSRLLKAYDVTVEIQGSGKSMFVAFYWADGTIFAEIHRHGEINWDRGKLEIYGFDAPETKRVAMSGRPLSDLVDLPFGGDIIVDRVDKICDGLRVRVAENEFMVELASGRTWKG